MRALILGANGQVGRALVAAAPPSVVAIAQSREECDVCDAASVAASLKASSPDIVFNAAAYTAVDQAESDAENAFRLNAQAVDTVARQASAAGARIVHISTDFVFSGHSSTPLRPQDPTGPVNRYGASKLAGERLALAADARSLIVRTAWIYAPRGSNFVTTMVRLIGERDLVRVVDDQIGSPTSAASLAGALWKLAAEGMAGIVHYTDSGVASWYDFAIAIREEALDLGLLRRAADVVPIPASAYPTAAARPAFSVLDKTETWKVLGTSAPHWRVNLRSVLKEMKARG